jgi:hypothetical protein
MSTEYIVLKRSDREVSIVEGTAKFDLNLYGYPEGMGASGPQNMTAEETLNMAAGIVYAVWCSYPGQADALVDAMADNDIPRVWDEIVRKRYSTKGE